jgi:DNA polymerase III sliding clamp (beta) subunit (PCNA family)
MKIEIAAQDLKRALNTCNEIAPASSAIAEEKTGVLVRAEGDFAVFTSSDDNLGVRVEVPAIVKEAGEALVKAGSVSTSVTATFEDVGFDNEPNTVTLATTSKSTLKVSGGNRVSEGQTLKHVRNFPLLNSGFFIEAPEFNDSLSTEFPTFQFMDGLSKVSHAASKDASKLHFNCIQLTLNDNEVVFAATDGIQIAEFRRAAEVNGLRGSFILGLKFATVASKLVNPAFDAVDMYVEDDQFFLKSGGTVLVGTLISTAFPDYTSYMVTEGLKLATFPRDAFMSVLQGMQPTVDAKSHRLVVDAFKKGNASLSTSSITGEAESSDLEVTTPADFTLHFDSMLLQNSLRQLKGEEFEFYFTPDARGVLLKSPKDEDFKAFVCTLKKVD